MPIPFLAAAVPWLPTILGTIAGAMGIAGSSIGLRDYVRSQRKRQKEAEQRGEESPVLFSDDQLTALQQLPEDKQEQVDALMNFITSDPDAFLGELDALDKEGLLNETQKELPTQQELGFPQSAQETISNLLGQTEFEPQEEYARRQFEQRTIPGLAERFAGQGALKSSAFQGQLGQAASDLESKLAALRSEYGLKRANVLGPMQQKQQALDLGQAQAARQLGLAERGQRFGEQHSLAQLGLAERGQELQRRGLNAGLLPSLLGTSTYQFMPKQQQPGIGSYLLGGAGALGGLGAQLYGQNQLLDLLKQFNTTPSTAGTGIGSVS